MRASSSTATSSSSSRALRSTAAARRTSSRSTSPEGGRGRTPPGRGEVEIVLRPTRLLAIGGLILVCVLYWKPIHSYERTQAVLRSDEAQVSRLLAEQRQLKARIAAVGTGVGLL